MNDSADNFNRDTFKDVEALREENNRLRDELRKANHLRDMAADGSRIPPASCAQTLSALEQASDELNTIFNLSRVGMLLLDGNRRVIRANPRVIEIFGYDSIEEVIHQHASTAHVSQEDFLTFDLFYHSVLKDKGEVSLEHRFKGKDGSFFWGSVAGKAVDSATPPDLDKGVLWIIDDVTEQHRARKELAQAHEEMETFFNNSMVGVVMLRGGRTVHRANQRMADILRYDSPRELEGRPVSQFHLSQDNCDEFGSMHYDRLMKGEVLQVEYPLLRKDGSTVVVEASGKAIDPANPPDLDKGVVWILLDISQRKATEHKLIEMANIDALTGVFSRRHFMEVGQRELSIHRRRQRPLSALMLDLDHFKNINDAFGHAMGDQALEHFATTCRNGMRTEDIIGRLGGEEFAIILPDTCIEEARMVAERIRLAVQTAQPENGAELPAMTVSIGMTAARRDDDMDSLLKRADAALYEAKKKGRNRVTTAPKEDKP